MDENTREKVLQGIKSGIAYEPEKLGTMKDEVDYLKERYAHLQELLRKTNRELTIAIADVGDILHSLQGDKPKEE